MSAAVASIAKPPVICGTRALRIWRRLAAVGAARAAIASQVLGRELLGQAVGIEALLQVLSLEVPLLTLVLSLLVGVLEIAPTIAIALLLCAPDLLLARLVRVYGLGKCAWCGGECPSAILVLLVAASAAEVQLQPIRLLVAVHYECERERLGLQTASVGRLGLQGGRGGTRVLREQSCFESERENVQPEEGALAHCHGQHKTRRRARS